MKKWQEGFARFVNAVSGGLFETYFREGVALDGTDEGDEGKYRRLTSKQRDLKPMEFKKVMDLSFYLWQRNPMAKRLVGIFLDFIVGDDLNVRVRIMKRVKDKKPEDTNREDAQKLWDKFKDDPINNWDADIDVLLSDYLVFGELLLPVALNEMNKLPRFGFIDVGLITRVQTDPSGRYVHTVYVQKPDQGAEDTPLRVIKKVAADKWEGVAFYFQYSRTMTKNRGQSFLCELLDWIDGFDQFQFNALEGSALRNSFFYDLTVKGADDKKLRELREQGVDSAPKPATVRMHNDAMEWNVVNPTLNAGETAETSRMHKNFILQGKGIPEHWFTDGGNTNLATADKMDIPVMQMLKREQKHIKNLIRQIAEYVVAVQAPGSLTLGPDEYLDFEVNCVDLEKADAAMLASAFGSLVTALDAAAERGWVSDDKAKEIIDGIVLRHGVQPDQEDVETILEKNKANREEDDLEAVADIYSRTSGGGGGGPVRRLTSRKVPAAQR